jgi:hypothetical protein
MDRVVNPPNLSGDDSGVYSHIYLFLGFFYIIPFAFLRTVLRTCCAGVDARKICAQDTWLYVLI